MSAALLLALLLLAPPPAAAQEAFQEHQVKAAFLYNFAKFVEWPAERFAGPAAPLVLCLHGADPFGPFLDELVAGEQVGGRRLVVDRSRPAGELRACHLLYVAAGERGRYARLLDGLGEAAVLTVGEDAEFLAAGGLFRFHRAGDRVRFEANLPAVARSRLQVSSKLLQVARPAGVEGP